MPKMEKDAKAARTNLIRKRRRFDLQAFAHSIITQKSQKKKRLKSEGRSRKIIIL